MKCGLGAVRVARGHAGPELHFPPGTLPAGDGGSRPGASGQCLLPAPAAGEGPVPCEGLPAAGAGAPDAPGHMAPPQETVSSSLKSSLGDTHLTEKGFVLLAEE